MKKSVYAVAMLMGLAMGIGFCEEPQERNPLANEMLALTEKAPWRQDFELVDIMQIHSFPADVISYEVNVPDGVDVRKMALLAFADGEVERIPFQLTGSAAWSADLQSATRTASPHSMPHSMPIETVSFSPPHPRT